MTDDCVFCRIAAGNIPAKILYQDDVVVAFADINPQAPVHALIIPRRHLASVEDVRLGDEALISHMIFVAQRVALELGVAASGYRLVANVGRDSGQLVPHLHFHLLGGRGLSPSLG